MKNKELYEVEIKVLLKDEKTTKALITKLKKNYPKFKLLSKSTQINPYFDKGDISLLLENLKKVLSKKKLIELKNTIDNSTEFTVRTRKDNDKIYFIVKATKDNKTDITNGVIRVEFQEQIPNITLAKLDKLILDSKYIYQCKWSRVRKQYRYKDMNVCIDLNAGYGYLAEFEKMISDKILLNETKNNIIKEVETLGYKELDHIRLDHMFKYYIRNWKKYFGTKKTFTIY